MNLANLNPQQRLAVTDSLECNTVVVAGAGAGKTRVLTTRVGYLIDDCDVNQDKIMVVTFTNKAANELKSRLYPICGDLSNMYIGTFHSICVKILRAFGFHLDIEKFTIMSPYTTRKIMGKVLQRHMVSNDKSNINKYLAKISRCKNDLKTPSKVREESKSDEEYLFAEIYNTYQKVNWKDKRFDFDDLIVYTISLLTRCSDVKNWFHENISYIMCDESQDTNGAQFSLLKSLAGDNNLFLVGDDDQSIYRFRQAKPEYLLNFKLIYPNSKTLLLEQNYRSTKTIVNASNNLVKNNVVRYNKTCFSTSDQGEPIILKDFYTPEDEATWIAREIDLLKNSINLKQIAILFRTNAQSRALEYALTELGIKFQSIGALSFYERKEIKDIVAFLNFIANPSDKESLSRALKTLPGIGDKTIDKLLVMLEYTTDSVCKVIEDFIITIKSIKQIKSLYKFIEILNNHTESVYQTISLIVEATGMIEALANEETDEANAKIDNINELISVSKEFEEKSLDKTLAGFLDVVSLTTTTDEEPDNNKVNLLTIHASKGLEFEVVFMCGMEEHLLPHTRANTIEDIEEERRLVYVGMTRAKQLLYMTNCKLRNDIYQNRSRFVDEIPKEYIIKL